MIPNDEETARRGREALREWRELEAAIAKCREVALAKLVGAPIGSDEVTRLHAGVQGIDMIAKALRLMASHGMVAEVALERAMSDAKRTAEA